MTNVVMPQMGESIAEGTIVRWIKKVGDQGRSRRAAVRDLDRQGRRGDPVAGRRRADRDQGQGRGDRSRQQRRGGDRRRGRGERAASRPASTLPEAAVGQPETPQGRRRADGAQRRQPTTKADQTPDSRRGPAAAEVVAARPPDRAGAQRRHPADPGHRDQRPGHEARHPRLHRVRRQACRNGGHRAAPAAASPTASGSGPGVQARRERADRADERDAQEDRRAHGAERAHVAARVLGVRGELRAGSPRCARSRRPRTRRPARS